MIKCDGYYQIESEDEEIKLHSRYKYDNSDTSPYDPYEGLTTYACIEDIKIGAKAYMFDECNGIAVMSGIVKEITEGDEEIKGKYSWTDEFFIDGKKYNVGIERQREDEFIEEFPDKEKILCDSLSICQSGWNDKNP